MYQHVIATYRRIGRLMGKSVGTRKSIPLNVFAMEERATPAVLPLFQAPETVRVLELAPVLQAAEKVDLPNASVRSDLFGVGGAGHSGPAQDWDEVLAADRDEKRDVASAPPTTPAAVEVETSEEVVVADVEEMWLPPLE